MSLISGKSIQQSCRRLSPRTLKFPTAARFYSSDNPIPANESKAHESPSPLRNSTNALPISSKGGHGRALQETPAEGEIRRVKQAPNRDTIWSRSQQPRTKAMVGPRFEQTIMEDQPRPMAAVELIHKQPVRWTKDRVVSCDGGGGPLGHPRIFINVDKPQICWCTYCGVPYAHEHHRNHLKSLSSTSYPLTPNSDAGSLPVSHLQGTTGSTEPLQTITGNPLEQR